MDLFVVVPEPKPEPELELVVVVLSKKNGGQVKMQVKF